MIKEQLQEPYSVSVQKVTEYPKKVKQHSFFELVYVLNGEGRHSVNDNKLGYRTGDLFLLTPQYLHDFRIVTATEFFHLRFNDVYLTSNGFVKDNIQRLEFLLYNAKQLPGSILQHETDKPLVKTMVESIIREHINRDNGWNKLTLALVNALVVVVARNIEKNLPAQPGNNKEEKTLNIIQYIQENIYHPERIKAENISHALNISIAYLGRYFKKHTGQTMQDYIANYKTKLIENRLQYSSMRLSEIVDELGFADESHLNKFFKKQKGINPSEYRKRHMS